MLVPVPQPVRSKGTAKAVLPLLPPLRGYAAAATAAAAFAVPVAAAAASAVAVVDDEHSLDPDLRTKLRNDICFDCANRDGWQADDGHGTDGLLLLVFVRVGLLLLLLLQLLPPLAVAVAMVAGVGSSSFARCLPRPGLWCVCKGGELK